VGIEKGGIMIRFVNDSDYKDITDIYNYYIKNTAITFEEEELSYSKMKERIDSIKNIFPYIVYVEDGKVLGYAYLSYFSERSAYRFSADLSIYLKNGLINKGIGSALYKRLEEIAMEKGFKKIISCITLSNERSISFHERMGFKECGRMLNVGYKMNAWHSVVWMDKDI